MTALTAAEAETEAETPAAPAPTRVAILGAGPVGLEAALACVERGWPCTVYESAATVGANVRAWGHVRLFTPWEMNVSPRMVAHLAAAGVAVPGPAGHFPSGAELADELLAPLAALPELAGVVELGTRVVAVARQGFLKHEAIASHRRLGQPFRLLLAGPDGTERVAHADLVLDCTGTYGQANTLGDGGIPAPGERRVADRILRAIPDVRAGGFAGATILQGGAGKSAQTTARDLAALAREHPGTRVVWAVRAAEPDWGAVPADPLPQRQELVDVAASLRAGKLPGVAGGTAGVGGSRGPAGPGGGVPRRGEGRGPPERVGG
ncbi:MAG: hypothetical protein ACT4RN_11435, partial [Pseudonocardia sp.]